MTSKSRAIRWESQRIVKFEKSMALTFLIVRERVIWQMSHLQFIIEKTLPDLLTLSRTFNDLSVACNLFSNAEMRQFGGSGDQRIWDCREPTG